MRAIENVQDRQTFTEGLAAFYSVENIAGAGNKPSYRLIKRCDLPLSYRKLGDVRYYAAMQADSKITMVIRVPQFDAIQPGGDVCIISGDSNQYQVSRVAPCRTVVPPSMDVTLSLAKTVYKEAEEQ